MGKEFLEKVNETFSEEGCQKIGKAFEYAKAAHVGQKRSSGEDYISHPCAVATILIDLGMDSDTVIAALLHDVLEDTTSDCEEIRKMFGENVIKIVNGVTKLTRIQFKSKEEEQAENLRKMFIAMCDDIRIIIVKLADRLHNMRTLSFKDKDGQVRISKETLEIFAPIAGRLGMGSIKCELEDLSMRYLYEDDYYELVEKVAAKKVERQAFVKNVSSEISKKLLELGIEAEINGRPKHFFSIFKKMKDGKNFDQIYDLIAVRIIVESEKDCYAVLGAIHTMWKPLPGRFKDYIAMPKANMYQSLHTTVISSFGAPFEIQIRTKQMHYLAELGVAAHWKYKEGKAGEQSQIDAKLSWIRQVIEAQKDTDDSHEFLNSIKMDLYTDEVFVFTPKGDVVSLPLGSTGVDFAYSVHSAVGNKCVGIKINSKIVPLGTQLETGNIVEVITSNSSKGPSRDWLKFVKTPSAKNKIRSFFKHELKEDNIKRGREMLERELKHRGYVLSELVTNAEWRKYVSNRYAINTVDDLYNSVGCGNFTANQVAIRLIDFLNKEIHESKPPLEIKEKEITTVDKKSSTNKKQSSGILIKGYDDFLIRISQCCNPVPGDKIIGYISRGRGVCIHRDDCPNTRNMEVERVVDAEWPQTSSQKFIASLDIFGQNRGGLMVDITTLISNLKMNLIKMSAKVANDDILEVKISVEITNVNEVENLKSKIKGILGIDKVYRSVGNK